MIINNLKIFFENLIKNDENKKENIKENIIEYFNETPSNFINISLLVHSIDNASLKKIKAPKAFQGIDFKVIHSQIVQRNDKFYLESFILFKNNKNNPSKVYLSILSDDKKNLNNFYQFLTFEKTGMYISSFEIRENTSPKYFYLETNKKFEKCFNETVNNTSENTLNILVSCLIDDSTLDANNYINDKIISTSLTKKK